MIGVVFCSVESFPETVSSLSLWFSGHSFGILMMFFTLLLSSKVNLSGSVCLVVDVDSGVVVVVVDVVEGVIDVVDVEVVVDIVTPL